MEEIEKIKKLLNEIISWSQKQIITKNNYNLLKDQLFEIIKISNKIKFDFDETYYKDYEKVGNDDKTLLFINKNFKKFAYYNIQSKSEAEILIGDPSDDLLDIINDFKEVIWRFENNSIDDALWFLDFGYKNHWWKHANDLLWYLSHLEPGNKKN